MDPARTGGKLRHWFFANSAREGSRTAWFTAFLSVRNIDHADVRADMRSSIFRWVPTILLTIALTGCSTARRAQPAASPHIGTSDRSTSRAAQASTRGPSRSASPRSTAPAPEPDEELGTVYGERRRSESYESPFERAHRRPDVVLSLWYDDADSLDRHHPWSSSTLYDPDLAVSLSVVDGRGRVLDAVDVGSQRHAVGAPGQRYELELTNHSAFRYEVVASVDGLDVIDGRPASTHKRGYILEPWDTLVIDGWRTLDDEVAAFRFGHVHDSYAARRGTPRNIGVIGVALFSEREHRSPTRRRRRDARPFDDRFAPPPGW